MQFKHLLLTIFVMVVFGSVYPLGKLGTNNIPPILFASLRVLVIFICILPFFNFKLPSKKLLLPLFAFSITMGIGVYLTLYLALENSSLVAPIIIGTQLTVPFGLILSYFFLNEKISFKKFILIIFSFIGILIVAYNPSFVDELKGLFIISLMAFFYALSNILSRFIKDIDIVTQITWHSFIGFLPLFMISIIIEGNPLVVLLPISINTILLIIHASLIVTLIGHGSLFYLYKFYTVSTVLPFYSLFPIFGIIFTFIIFFEVPNLFEIIGGTIVIGSVYLIHLENKKIIKN